MKKQSRKRKSKRPKGGRQARRARPSPKPAAPYQKLPMPEREAIAVRLCLMGKARRKAAAAVGMAEIRVRHALDEERERLLENIRTIEEALGRFAEGEPVSWSSAETIVAPCCNRLLQSVRAACVEADTLANVTSYCILRQAFGAMAVHSLSYGPGKQGSLDALRRLMREAMSEPTAEHLVARWLGVSSIATVNTMESGYRTVLNAIGDGLDEWGPKETPLGVPSSLPSYPGAWGNRVVNLSNLVRGHALGTRWDDADAERDILPGSEWSIAAAWRTLSVLLPLAVMVGRSTAEQRRALADTSVAPGQTDLGLLDPLDRACAELASDLGLQYGSGVLETRKCFLELRRWCDLEVYSSTGASMVMAVHRDQWSPELFAKEISKAKSRMDLLMNETIPLLLPEGRQMLRDPKIHGAIDEPLTRFMRQVTAPILRQARDIATQWIREAREFYRRAGGSGGALGQLKVPSISPDLLAEVDLEW